MATRLSSILDSAFVDRIGRRMCVSESKQKESVVGFQVSNCINIHVSKLHVIIKVVCSTSRKPTFHAGHYPWWWGLACVPVLSYTCFSFSIEKWHSRAMDNQSKQVDGERYWKPVILTNKFSPKLDWIEPGGGASSLRLHGKDFAKFVMITMDPLSCSALRQKCKKHHPLQGVSNTLPWWKLW